MEDVAGGGQRAAVRRLQEQVQPTCIMDHNIVNSVADPKPKVSDPDLDPDPA